jgi:hypothetical protein
MRVPPIACANPVHGDDDDDGGQDEEHRGFRRSHKPLGCAKPRRSRTAGLRETETIP